MAKSNKIMLMMLSIFYNFFGFNKTHNTGKGNKIYKKYSFMRRCKINIKGNRNRIILKEGVRLNNCSFSISGNNNTIIIGRYTTVFNAVFCIEDNYNKISVGEKSELNRGEFSVTENNSNLIIGDYCLFSSDIEIRNGDSHSIIALDIEKRINYAKDVVIGNHVWVCAHVRILKGVRILNDVVIANSAVLTKPIDKSYCIVGGFPAKVIKENVTWDSERIYENNNPI